MIVAVTLNASLDRYGEIESLIDEEPMALQKVRTDAGGKGINIVRMLQAFGETAMAVTILGGENGAQIARLLESQNIAYDALTVRENTRSNLTVFDRSAKRVLKFNEPGPQLDTKLIAAISELIGKYDRKGNTFIFSGSLPPGWHSDSYRYLIAELKDVKPVFLDTSGEPLRQALSQPNITLCKPNRAEAESLIGRKLISVKDFRDAIGYFGQADRWVFISDGANGAVFIDPDSGKLTRAAAPKVETVSAVGCGDAFVGGFALATVRGKSFIERVRFATACAAASATLPGTQMTNPEQVAALIDRVGFQLLD